MRSAIATVKGRNSTRDYPFKMEIHDVEEIQIQSLRPEPVESFWLFDRSRRTNLSDEVESLARRCKTASPNALKLDLYHERRPHSTAGVPFQRTSHRKKKQFGSKSMLQRNNNPRNLKEEGFKKVLQRFQPQMTNDVRIGPGYVITKKNHDIFAKVNTNQSLIVQQHIPAVGERRFSTKSGNERDWQTIEDLKQKIDDLTVLLEDVKVQHRLELKQIHDLHVKNIDKLNKEHEEHIRAIELDNAEDTKKIDDDYKITIQAIRTDALKETNELSRLLKVAKAALDTYKETVMREMNSKWKENELELKLEHERRTDKLLLDQKNELIAHKNNELDTVTKEHRRQIALIVESNKKEMDILLRKFTASVADAERLKAIMEELEQFKLENEQMKEEVEKSRKLHRTANNELHDAKLRLQMYKDHFAEKVSEVDEKYSQKINGLMIDNSSLRQQYMKKCDELYRAKCEREIKQEDNLTSVKNVMQQLILTRTRADVSLTALRDDDASSTTTEDAQSNTKRKSARKKEPKRPSSAPSTDKEMTLAVRSSSEGYHTVSPDHAQRPPRPASSHYKSLHGTYDLHADNPTLSLVPPDDLHNDIANIALQSIPPAILLETPSRKAVRNDKLSARR